MTNSNLKFENNPAPGDKSSGFVIAPGPGFSIFGGYMRGLFREKNPAWNGGIRNGQDGRMFILKPEHYRADINGYVLRSVLLAEKALGGPIPNGALVHHFDGNPANDHKNLILCENNKHHHLLHQRKRAYDACTANDTTIRQTFIFLLAVGLHVINTARINMNEKDIIKQRSYSHGKTKRIHTGRNRH